MRMPAAQLSPAAAACLTVVALTLPSQARAQASAYEELQNFSALLNHVRLNYVDEIDYSRLTLAAMQGVLLGLDPHSYFLTANDLTRLEGFGAGELAGVGIRLEQRGESVVVISVRRFGPADLSDVHPGDRMVAVDDTSVAGLGAREVEVRLLGKPGSKVALGLERGSRLEPQMIDVRLERKKLPGGSVAEIAMRKPGVGYVRVEQFEEDAGKELKKALEEIVDRDASLVLLDLRGNPGGILDEAVEAASIFLRTNRPVFTTRGRKAEMNQEYRTRGNGKFRDIGLVVLIDEGSASASEVLAASLQDNDRALIVGRRSFGKALIQTAFFLPRGHVVMLTVGRVYAPSGRLIQRDYEGMTSGQYRSLAGESPEADTVVYQTLGGRPVRGGGGVRPDVEAPAPAALPAWWAESVAHGFPLEVATEAASGAPGTVDAWAENAASWEAMLLDPYLERVREELSIEAEATRAESEVLARELAALVAGVRWGRAGQERFLLLTDPDIKLAVEAYRERLAAARDPDDAGGGS